MWSRKLISHKDQVAGVYGLLSLLLLSACSDADEPENIITYFDHINPNKERIHHINLDRAQKDTTIFATRENILGYTHEDSGSPFVTISSIQGFGDSIYVAGMDPAMIYVLDEDGHKNRTISRRGSGPGEFYRVASMSSQNDQLKILSGEGKLISFDHQLQFKTEVTLEGVSTPPFATKYSFDQNHVFAPLYDQTQKLVGQVDQRTGEVVDSLITPINTSKHHLPNAYNDVLISNNVNGDIVFGFSGFGILKKYRKGKRDHLIELHSSLFEEITPELNGIADDVDPEGVVPSLIQALHLRENGDIVVATRSNYLFYLQKYKNDYKITGRFQLKKYEGDPTAPQAMALNSIIISEHDNYLYFSGPMMDYPYRFPVSLFK